MTTIISFIALAISILAIILAVMAAGWTNILYRRVDDNQAKDIFPANPLEGQRFTDAVGGNYVYNAAYTRWEFLAGYDAPAENPHYYGNQETGK